jgi:CubicO group peptidase (beta-lactamase class C family)
VEKASGVPYARFVTEHVLDPLDMRETFVGNAHGRDNLARGHRAGEELASWDLDSASRGAGDIWTTARDLDRWDVALCSDALLPHDSRAEMFRTRVPIDGLGFVTGYGFGWLTGELHDQPLYLHAGDNPGFMGLNAIVPALQARVIVLSNDDTTDVFTPAIGYLEAIAT